MPANSVISSLDVEDTGDQMGQAYDYELFMGEGSDDNSLFNIEGDQLRTSQTFDFESDKPTYSIRIRVTDRQNQSLSRPFVLTLLDVNEPPTMVVKEGLTVVKGASAVIGRESLLAFDPESARSPLTYNIIEVPLQGAIQKQGVELIRNGQFTQDDINSGKIIYVQTSENASSDDSFRFTVSDGENESTAQLFAITILEISVGTPDPEDEPLGLGDDKAKELVISPIPTSRKLNFRMENATIGSLIIRLSTLLGCEVWERMANKPNKVWEHTIDLSDLPKGIYMLEVISEGQRWTKKVVKN